MEAGEAHPYLIRGDRGAAADAAPAPAAGVVRDHLARHREVAERRGQEPRIVEVLEEGVGDPLPRRRVLRAAVASVLRDEQFLRSVGDRLEENVAEVEGVPRSSIAVKTS